ncbi:MAG: ATP-binding protein [Minicystis sp.]
MPADLPTRDVLDSVLGVLTRYVSAPTAQSILGVARQRSGIRGSQLTRSQLRDMIDPIERSLAFFLSDASQAKACRKALEALATVQAQPASAGPVVVRITTEDDIARARSEARVLAVMLGFTLVGQTRLMTAVSELARNIVQYAGEGQIELNPTTLPAGLEIVARDRGPGIQKLSHILSGNYKSKLGMGLGLLGVKRLAERFDIETEPGLGTTVSALLKVA